jgi:integrase
VAKRLPIFLRPAEQARLLAAIESERDRLIVLLGIRLGLRVSEICKLRVEHLGFEDEGHESLLVYKGKGDKDRLLPIPSTLIQPLRAWIGERRDGWVFESPYKPGSHLTTRAVQYLIPKLAASADIARARITPHKLRHTFATNRRRRGVDLFVIKELMGHARIETTAIYLHADTDELKDAVEDD